MKSLVLALGILLAAQAHALKCTDIHAGPDHGYNLKFSKSNLTVWVSEDSIAGPQPVGKLLCTKQNSPVNLGPDQIYTILTCVEPQLADAGFSLHVETGGFAGLTTATLSQVSIAGATPVAHFACRP